MASISRNEKIFFSERKKILFLMIADNNVQQLEIVGDFYGYKVFVSDTNANTNAGEFFTFDFNPRRDELSELFLAIADNSSITNLTLEIKDLSDQCIADMLNMLHSNKSIKHLCTGKFYIGRKPQCAFFECISKNTYESICLFETPIPTEKCANAFLESISVSNPGLQRLELVKCGLGSKVAEKLRTMILSLPSLEVLNLRSNKLGFEGFEILADIVKPGNSNLVSINFYENILCDYGPYFGINGFTEKHSELMNSFANFFEENHCIVDFFIEEDDCLGKIRPKIREYIDRNRRLREEYRFKKVKPIFL